MKKPSTLFYPFLNIFLRSPDIKALPHVVPQKTIAMKTSATLILSLLFLTFNSKLLAKEPVLNQQLSFKENKGQVHDQFFKTRPDILFSGSDGKLVFHLKQNGISYQLNKVDNWEKQTDDLVSFSARKNGGHLIPVQGTIYRVDINWLNCNLNSEIKKGQALEGYDNFYLESCPQGALHVKSYTDILYKNLYAGIDLKWYEKNGNLKYDYLVAANADYKLIQLEYKGAENISVNSKGELVIQTPLGELVEQKPYVTQQNKKLEANWIVRNNIISFDIKNVDPSQSLIIDPLVRLWATFFGGALKDESWFVCSDVQNNVYISGSTQSIANIATVGSFQTTYGGTGVGSFTGDAFVTKFNSIGNRIWSTYYGGSGSDFANSCAADVNLNIYMTGATTTTNSAVMVSSGCHQNAYGGNPPNGVGDAILVKFDLNGIRQWGTYYGDAGAEWGLGVTVDISGDIYMVGGTSSTLGIATPGSHQPTYAGGNNDAFLAKFSPAGNRIWGTYYGGSAYDNGHDCITDLSGNVYFTGEAGSTDPGSIATPGAHQSNFGGNRDVCLVKFNSSGQRLWGTYYGGAGADLSTNCKIDINGNVYLSGISSSTSGIASAAPGVHQPTYGGGTYDGFLAVFDPSGTRQWATYYGGTGSESYATCSVDRAGQIYLAGIAGPASATAIVTPCTYQTNYGGGAGDLFLAKFSNTGLRSWGTYYGGYGHEYVVSCSTDGKGDIYLTGTTSSTSGTVIASASSYQPLFGGGAADGFLVKFDSTIIPPPVVNLVASNPFACVTESITLTASGAANYSWTISSANTSTLQVYLLLPTTYTVWGEDAYGCVATATAAVNPNLCLGLEEDKIHQQLLIYPNPNNGIVTIQSASDAGLLLTNELGQEIRRIELSSSTNYKITINDLPNGIYFLKSEKEDQSFHQKIIVFK